MDKTILDAKTASDSSTEAEESTQNFEAPASTEGSSSSKTESSEAQETLADVIRNAAKTDSQPVEDTENTESEKIEESDVQELDTTEKEPGKEESAPEEEKTESEEAPPPFHEHPRWKKLTSERNELKEQLESVKPLAENQRSITDYCSQNGITPQQFQELLELGALANNDPVAFKKRLDPIVQSLSAFDGSVLDKDLADRVETGDLTEKAAAEIMQLRAKVTQKEAMAKRQTVTQQQRVVLAMEQAVAAWHNATHKRDLEFKPTPGNKFGRFEAVHARFQQLATATPPSTPQEAVALVQRAYDEVGGFVKPTVKAAPTRRTPSSTQSSTTSSQEPKTLQEAINRVIQKQSPS